MNLTNIVLGAVTVITTTNFWRVEFKPLPCEHPGCDSSPHGFAAIERYVTVRATWAESDRRHVPPDADGVTRDHGWVIAPPSTNSFLLSTESHELLSLTKTIAHPSVYYMHTRPGWPVRPGTRWKSEAPPMPSAPSAVGLQRRRSTTTNMPSDFAVPALPGSRRFVP